MKYTQILCLLFLTGPGRICRSWNKCRESKNYSSTVRRKMKLPGVRSKDATTGNQTTKGTHDTTQARLSLREHKKSQREEAAASSHFLPRLGELMKSTLSLS